MFHSVPIFALGSGGRTCHCATLVALRDGDIMAAWFAGSFETAPDQAIYAARFQSRPSRWMPPAIIADTPDHADGQPVLYAHPGGSLWLFFVTIAGRDWKSAQLKLQKSPDGIRWDAPRMLNDRLGLMFRSKPLILRDGNILLPIYDETRWQSMSMISTDGGESWRLGEPIVTPPGNIHPCVVPLSYGRLLAFLRTGGEGGWIWQTTSDDGGWTWQEATPTRFPNPNSGIDLLRLRNGHLVLAFNDSQRRRTPLCVALSDDEGQTWNYRRTLEEGDAEFSYPALLQTRDGNLHCVYTYRRETIQHAVFDESWLKERTGN
jgi:predicted neuraminidase